MAYDPQAGRRRPQPDVTDPAPVDAILGEAADPAPLAGVPEDPPPSPGVTPAPADPPSDTVLLNTGLAAALGGLVTLFALRHFWNRHKRRRLDSAGDR